MILFFVLITLINAIFAMMSKDIIKNFWKNFWNKTVAIVLLIPPLGILIVFVFGIIGIGYMLYQGWIAVKKVILNYFN
jgi:hypothetical protein